MTDIRRVGDTGIRTVEGAVAGNLASSLSKAHQLQQEQYESMKSKIKENNMVNIKNINEKFSSSKDVSDEGFRSRTIGLVTAEEFRKVRYHLEQIEKVEYLRKLDEEKELNEKKEKHRNDKRKLMTSKLSFMADEEDNDEDTQVIKKISKNPNIDTSFLPDRERDRKILEEKQKKDEEWILEQEVIKKETLNVVYSYWDGNGHRKSIQVTKGMTIAKFLELVRNQIMKEFPDLRSVNVDGLMYIKEDTIIPQDYTFYDLIIAKGKGKSGPLFHFDVHQDIRLVHDVRIETDHSHAGKVVLRRWYEKNKHMFPASRWEVYKPSLRD